MTCFFPSNFTDRESTFKTKKKKKKKKENPEIYKESLNWLKENLVILLVIGFFFLTKCEDNQIIPFSS